MEGAKAMSSIAYDELKEQIDVEFKKFDYLTAKASYQFSHIMIVYYALRLWLLSRSLLRTIDKMDKCASEKDLCDATCITKNKTALIEMNSSLQRLIYKGKQKNIKSFAFNIMKNICVDYEDKIENYELATDVEARELFTKLAEKAKQGAFN